MYKRQPPSSKMPAGERKSPSFFTGPPEGGMLTPLPHTRPDFPSRAGHGPFTITQPRGPFSRRLNCTWELFQPCLLYTSIYASADSVTMKKYYPENELSSMAANLQEAVDDMCVDLGPKKTGDIRRHIREIQNLLKQEN